MFIMRMLPFAQSILEYVGLGSRSAVTDSVSTFVSNLWTGLLRIDQQTWMIIGVVLMVLWFLTRRSRMR